jgi:Protein of unknown function (DUF3617)
MRPFDRWKSLARRPFRAARVLLLLLPVAAPAGEFMAYPGLWKTTLQLASESSPTESNVTWHCVDEGEDPWSAFAQLSLPEGEAASCKQTQSERTATSLAWTVECKGPPLALVNKGQVTFDSPSHYRGEVQVNGTFMGYPVSSRITVEGQRYAACTSPKD